MFNLLHSISNQELFEKHLYNPRILKERNGAVRPSYINYHLKSEAPITLHCRLCSTHYTAVRIKNCLKSTSAIKTATIKIQTISIMKGSHHVLFVVSKDEWDTKEDNGKSMKNALYVLRYAKGTFQAEATSNTEKIKPVAIAVIELYLPEGIRQSVIQ